MHIENQAFQQLWMTISVATVSLIFGPILSCIMFKWINGSLHPYHKILADQIKENKKVENDKKSKVLLVSISYHDTQ